MPADMFSLKIDTAPIWRKLARLPGITRPPVILKVIALYMRQSVAKTFSTQGTGYFQWAPLAASTIRARRNKGKSSIKMLQDTGRLKNSIQFTVTGNSLVIGTNVVYAAAQQEGTGGLGRARIGSFSSIQMISLRRNGRLSKVKGRGQGRGGGIPARPFVVFRPEDEPNINQRVQKVIDVQIARLNT